MAGAQPNTSYTPLSLRRERGASNKVAPTPKKALEDGIKQLRDIAAEYDDDFARHSELLEPVADTIEATHDHRRSATAALREDLESWIDAVKRAKAEADSTDGLENARRRIAELESEKSDLMKEILHGKEESAELRESLKVVGRELMEIRLQKDVLSKKEETELPTLVYLQKVLRNLSGTKITSPPDSNVLEGFVCKKDSHDVLPFRYDESVSEFDRVNDLWNLIGQH